MHVPFAVATDTRTVTDTDRPALVAAVDSARENMVGSGFSLEAGARGVIHCHPL